MSQISSNGPSRDFLHALRVLRSWFFQTRFLLSQNPIAPNPKQAKRLPWTSGTSPHVPGLSRMGKLSCVGQLAGKTRTGNIGVEWSRRPEPYGERKTLTGCAGSSLKSSRFASIRPGQKEAGKNERGSLREIWSCIKRHSYGQGGWREMCTWASAWPR